MGNIGQFNKAIVALIMAAIMVVQRVWHIDVGLDEGTVTIIVAALTPILVYLVPNVPATSPASSTLRSPAVATAIAFGLALAVILGLTGCASFSLPKDPTLQQRVDAGRTDLNTVGIFMAVYAIFPRCGVGVPQPCSYQNVIDMWLKGRVAADAALQVATDLIANGAPEDKILVALADAQAAVAAMRNLKANAGG